MALKNVMDLALKNLMDMTFNEFGIKKFIGYGIKKINGYGIQKPHTKTLDKIKYCNIKYFMNFKCMCIAGKIRDSWTTIVVQIVVQIVRGLSM